ncbi:MAG: squalene/phytoene synthase family protein [Pseudomonadota bacterium]|nr:squalene/phytoene synthase family protein [Pseudomonadota bacterium]
MKELDPDRTLALAYVPAARREAVRALWGLDAALGAVLAGGREPLISRIKLAWWRDSLQKLDHSKAPGEPVLEAVSNEILPRGVRGGELSGLEEGWSVLLSEEPLTSADLEGYATARGALVFRYSARLLGAELTSAMERAGEGWALVDLARHSNPVDGQAAVEAARQRFGGLTSGRWPSALRPLGMLAALARRDAERGIDQIEPQGAPPRMWVMLRHRITGR